MNSKDHGFTSVPRPCPFCHQPPQTDSTVRDLIGTQIRSFVCERLGGKHLLKLHGAVSGCSSKRDLGHMNLAGINGCPVLLCGHMEFVAAGRTDFDRNLPTWSIGQFLSRVPLAIIRGGGQFVSAFDQLCRELEVQPHTVIRAESFGQVRQLLLAGHAGGILPKPLATELPATEFHIIDDPVLDRLSRELVVVIDSRVARLKDRLAELAGDFAKAL